MASIFTLPIGSNGTCGRPVLSRSWLRFSHFLLGQTVRVDGQFCHAHCFDFHTSYWVKRYVWTASFVTLIASIFTLPIGSNGTCGRPVLSRSLLRFSHFLLGQIWVKRYVWTASFVTLIASIF